MTLESQQSTVAQWSLDTCEPDPRFAQQADYLKAWVARNWSDEWINPTELQAQLLFAQSCTAEDAIRFRSETGYIDVVGLLVSALEFHGGAWRPWALEPHACLAAFVSDWWQLGRYRLYHLEREHDVSAAILLDIMEPFRASRVLMSEDEVAEFDALPERLTIWRGGGGPKQMIAAGYCWTLDRDVAESFAKRNEPYGPPTVVQRRISKRSVIAYYGDRENEIVVRPSKWALREYGRAVISGLVTEQDRDEEDIEREAAYRNCRARGLAGGAETGLAGTESERQSRNELEPCFCTL